MTPFIHGRYKTPIEEIQAAVDGTISEGQAVKLRQCLNHIDELENHKKGHYHLSYEPDRYLAHTHRFKAIYTRWFS